MSTTAALALYWAALIAVVLDVRREVTSRRSPLVTRLLLAALVVATATGVVLTGLRLAAGG